MKCIYCRALFEGAGPLTEANESMCPACLNFAEQLENVACTCRRPIIVNVLLRQNFNIVDLDADVSCPVACGHCCKTGWASVLSLRYKFGNGENGEPCPHLKEPGCELARKDRPNGCVSFLCPLGMAVLAEQVSLDTARQMLQDHHGDSIAVAQELRLKWQCKSLKEKLLEKCEQELLHET